MTAERLGYRPGLDGLRGIAVLTVMVAHTFRFDLIGTAGPVGVWLFFVLSGFLITRLLVEEQRDEGRIHRGAFYLRRARRLLPALPLALVLMVAVNAALGVGSGPGLVGAATYTSNFADIGRWNGAFAGMWSLAIEEHFYLVWPVVVAAVAPHRLGRFAAAGCVVVWLARWQLAPTQDAARLVTWYRADALLAGAALAVWWPRLPRPSRFVSWCAAAVLSLLGTWWSGALLGWGGGVASVCCAVLVIRAVSSTMRRPGLEYVGKRSYGLYLFHGPLALLCTETGASLWLVVAMTPVSFVLAELSWRVVERRFSRSRHLVGGREVDDVADCERSGERLARLA